MDPMRLDCVPFLMDYKYKGDIHTYEYSLKFMLLRKSEYRILRPIANLSAYTYRKSIFSLR